MKAFTDLEQSKKLSKILSLKSADMMYIASADDDDGGPLYTAEYKSEIIIQEDDENIHCWSLAALADILRKDFEVCIIGYEKAWKCHVTNRKTLVTDWLLADNPIDCCYEMILKLHELKML